MLRSLQCNASPMHNSAIYLQALPAIMKKVKNQNIGLISESLK